MADDRVERRKYERYDSELKVYFHVTYDVKTKVAFQIVDTQSDGALSKKYIAISKNVSAEGIRFASDRKLEPGDRLNLEVYVPRAKKPVFMEGVVVWSTAIAGGASEAHGFDSAVRITMVNHKSVSETIHVDTRHGIVWSIVLESVFGTFKALAHAQRSDIAPPSSG